MIQVLTTENLPLPHPVFALRSLCKRPLPILSHMAPVSTVHQGHWLVSLGPRTMISDPFESPVWIPAALALHC